MLLSEHLARRQVLGLRRRQGNLPGALTTAGLVVILGVAFLPVE